MCLIRWFYNYSNIRKNIYDEWEKFIKNAGMCNECSKFSGQITSNNKLCYRCFENDFYDNI
jgi:hypothetical protein